ncbi:MAG: leucine-rich repeat protein [Clostridia bacterium]|nr:leucine-rich repeat protein [Clostridia bacterium]
MSKKKTLLSAILAIVFCMSLIAGSTFALFTSESKVNIAVQSGKVEVVASVEGMNTYSVENDDAISEEADDYAGTVAENKLGAGKYKYVAQPAGQFSEGGTAVYDEGTLTLNKMIPGDKVTFNVNIANNSNVNIKYRVIVQVENGLKLFTALKVKIDGTSFTGVKRTGAWTSLAANGNIAAIPVEIYMPVDTGNEYQDLSTSMYISIEAVQGNAKTVDGALTAEVAAVAEDKTKVNTTTNKTEAATTISDNDDLVTVSIPSGTKLTSTAAADENDELSLAVKVKPQDTVSNITILSTQASASYDVSVLLVVNNEVTDQKAVNNADNDEEITVSMFIGAGLTGVKLYHNTDEIAYDNYNSETGYITFKTKSFSEYTVVYNADYAKETFDEEGNSTGIVVYEATETAGVYTTKDENKKDVYVTVTTDETTGEATEQVSDSILVTGDDGVIFRKKINGDLYIYDMSDYEGAEYTVPENVNGFEQESFKGNTTIKTLTFTNQINSAYKALDGNSSITTVNFGAMTSIPNLMFYACTGIKQIEIPATVKRIEDWAFYGNTAIETIVAADLEYVGYKAVDACSALKVLDIGGENVKIMNRAGRGVSSIETIIIRGANATVNHTYVPTNGSESDKAENYAFSKTQSPNPGTMPGIEIYVANDTVAEYFATESNAGATITYVSDLSLIKTQEEFTNLVNNAVAGEKTTIYLGAGTFTIGGGKAGSKLEIIGKTDKQGNLLTTIDNAVGTTNYKTLAAAEAVFKNINFVGRTIDANPDDSKACGFAHNGNITYQNCNFTGSHSFFNYSGVQNIINCTFNIDFNGYAAWIYGTGTYNISGCTFNTDGKAIKLYANSNQEIVNISNCSFNATTERKAAVNIDTATTGKDDDGNPIVGTVDCTLSGTNTLNGEFSKLYNADKKDGTITVNG